LKFSDSSIDVEVKRLQIEINHRILLAVRNSLKFLLGGRFLRLQPFFGRIRVGNFSLGALP
jgi:hypothetical protein